MPCMFAGGEGSAGLTSGDWENKGNEKATLAWESPCSESAVYHLQSTQNEEKNSTVCWFCLVFLFFSPAVCIKHPYCRCSHLLSLWISNQDVMKDFKKLLAFQEITIALQQEFTVDRIIKVCSVIY